MNLLPLEIISFEKAKTTKIEEEIEKSTKEKKKLI